jgi:3-hydroxyacyl-CoA dehydrogenase
MFFLAISVVPSELRQGDLGIRVGSADPKFMDEVVASGMLGRKAGKGMFLYPGGKVCLLAVEPRPAHSCSHRARVRSTLTCRP